MREGELEIDHEEDVLVFKDKKVRLRTNREENLIATLEMVGKWEEKDTIDLVEKEDVVKSDDEINSVIEQENDKEKIQEKVSENLDSLDRVNLDITKDNEDKMGEVLVDNENVGNKIGYEGDVRLEEMIKEKIEERNKKIEVGKGLSNKQQRR